MAVLLGLCAGIAFVWIEFENLVGPSPARDVGSTLGMSPEDRGILFEIQSAQQTASNEIAELNRNISAQLTDLPRLSDQVAALNQRLDSLQNPAPVAALTPALSSPPAHSPSKPTMRTLTPPKPEGPVSVGGAPLIAAPNADRR